MPFSTASILICHGDDEYAIATHLRAIEAEFCSGDMGDINLTRLDGASANQDELVNAVTSIPFFAEKRLVVLSNPLPAVRKRPGGREESEEGEETDTGSAGEKKQKFLAFLNNVPETTILTLVIADNQAWSSKKREYDWEVLKDSHYLVKWAKENKERVELCSFALPRQEAMPGWITREAGKRGLKFNPAAAVELAQYVGNDTRLASKELEKLDLYLGDRRAVEAADIAAICTFTSSVTIWQLVDAMGEKNTHKALEVHHQLLETMDAREIFPMIIRQFRLLLMAREVMDARGNEAEVAAQVGVAPFQAKNLIKQAANFDRAALQRIYFQLMGMEEDSKSSGVEMPVLIDGLIIQASGYVNG